MNAGRRQPRSAARSIAAGIFCFALVTAPGCDRLPGVPDPENRPKRPDQITDFATLYAHNCSGCHGADGTLGAARPLNDAVYLAIAGDEVLHDTIARGRTGTAMPAFAKSAGGTLTDAQIGILVREMRAQWGRPGAVSDVVSLPAYATPYGESLTADAGRGRQAYTEYCSGCHGADGHGDGSDAQRGGSIVEGAYLELASEQSIRVSVIAGRTDLGMPDWRGGDSAARPMSGREITDVVAWIVGHKPAFPGRPYPAGNATATGRESGS